MADTAGKISISDTIGDSGGAKTNWAIAGSLSDVVTGALGYYYSMWWRVVGNSPTGKVIHTVNWDGASQEIDAGEFNSTDSGIWQVDGIPVSASAAAGTNPSAGNITTTGHSFIYCRHTTFAGGTPTAGAGFTREFTGAPGGFRESMEYGEFDSVANQACNWTEALTDYLVMASAFNKQGGFTAVNRRSLGPRVGSRSYY